MKRYKGREKKYQHEWYLNNLESKKEKRNQRKVQIRKWLQDYKKTLSCQKCGYNNFVGALDFHHRDPRKKDLEIGSVIRNGWSMARIKEEISKCDVLCANCHRELENEIK